MKKLITTTALAAAAISTTIALAGPANATDGCTPSNGTDAAPDAWALGFTDWSKTETPPADPDGSGEDNLANLIQIGKGWPETADPAYRQNVRDGVKGVTSWSTSDAAPLVAAGEEVGHRYTREVGNGDATKGTPGVWENFSPNDDKGPFDGPPDYPYDKRGTWNAHGELPPGQAGPDGVYQNGNGNGSWFYREAGTPAKAETFHTEYQFDVYAFHYEYRWSVYQRGIIEGTAPVTCDTDEPAGETTDETTDEPTNEPTEEPTVTPETQTDEPTETPQTPATPPVAEVLAAHTTTSVAHVPAAHTGASAVGTTPVAQALPVQAAAHTPKQHRAPVAVPTTIDAGL